MNENLKFINNQIFFNNVSSLLTIKVLKGNLIMTITPSTMHKSGYLIISTVSSLNAICPNILDHYIPKPSNVGINSIH